MNFETHTVYIVQNKFPVNAGFCSRFNPSGVKLNPRQRPRSKSKCVVDKCKKKKTIQNTYNTKLHRDSAGIRVQHVYGARFLAAVFESKSFPRHEFRFETAPGKWEKEMNERVS